jgi:hypothetical protein
MAQAALAFRQRPYDEGFPTRPKPYTNRKWLAWPNEGDVSEDQLPQHRLIKKKKHLKISLF